MKPLSARALSASLTFQVVEKNQSLSQLLDQQLSRCIAKDRSLTQEICYGVLRYLPRLEDWVQQLMDKPLKGKYRSGHFLLLTGLYQLFYMRIPAHAAVSETVQASRELKLGNFSKLINGVLRSAERRRDELLTRVEQKPSLQWCHPSWLSELIKNAYPEQWPAIMAANNERAPMWLRVNQSRGSRSDYLDKLTTAGISAQLSERAVDGLCLDSPVGVDKLPGFYDGLVSVQDGAAQLAARLLDPQPGERVLDACAAPGGKTGHLLELQPNLELLAVDQDPQRLTRVHENLQRLAVQATIVQGDASTPEQWTSEPFDRILLDAPCSATGVIRRHPDIKWLRRANDIAALSALQKQILEQLWQWLKPGGTLLYATCSILPAENRSQIRSFLQTHPDARLMPVHPDESNEQPGWQLLPGEQQMDGFFYARLVKQEA